MGTGVSGPHASAGRLWRTRHHGSTERRVARRPHQARRTLAGRLTVEPSSVRAACVLQADERVRPSTRRPSLHAHRLQRYALLLSARPPPRLVHAGAPARATHHLPAVLRVEDGRRRLAAAPPCHTHVSCPTVSRLGLRLHAALCLQLSDRDGQRLQGPVHRGQGATERSGPCPLLPSRGCVPPGTPSVISPGACPPLGALTPTGRRPLPR